MRGLLLLLITLFSVLTLAAPKWTHVQVKDPKTGKPLSLTVAKFKDMDFKDYKAALRQAASEADEMIVMGHPEDLDSQWFAEAAKIEAEKTFISSRVSKKTKLANATIALVRTSYSVVFWVMMSDFSASQALSMSALIAATQYSFVYRKDGLKILNFSKKLGAKALSFIGLKSWTQKSKYSTVMNLWTSFNISMLMSFGFLGVIEWDSFADRLAWGEPLTHFIGEMVTYSLGAVFATGGWNSFLSDQRYGEKPVISGDGIDWIHNINGVLLSLSFPMIMNDNPVLQPIGWALVGSMGVSGLIMALRGHKIWPLIKGLKSPLKSACQRILGRN